MRRLGLHPSQDIIQPQRTMIVDLTAPEEEIMARMKQKTRYNIRLAEKKGVTVRVATPETTLADLKTFLNDRVSVFVGQSGVGKSSLIATLLPGEDLRIGALSENTRKGKHTTTTARLYHFPAGGDLIDSPGIREFGLWHMSPEEVMYGFRELRDIAGHCRFRDCAHESEPGCAIIEALENGEISDERFFSYKRILSTLTEL